MSPAMLHQFWSFLEDQANIPLTLDDESLVLWLVRQLRTKRTLNNQETDLLSDYIHSRLPMIRQLASEGV